MPSIPRNFCPVQFQALPARQLTRGTPDGIRARCPQPAAAAPGPPVAAVIAAAATTALQTRPDPRHEVRMRLTVHRPGPRPTGRDPGRSAPSAARRRLARPRTSPAHLAVRQRAARMRSISLIPRGPRTHPHPLQPDLAGLRAHAPHAPAPSAGRATAFPEARCGPPSSLSGFPPAPAVPRGAALASGGIVSAPPAGPPPLRCRVSSQRRDTPSIPESICNRFARGSAWSSSRAPASSPFTPHPLGEVLLGHPAPSRAAASRSPKVAASSLNQPSTVSAVMPKPPMLACLPDRLLLRHAGPANPPDTDHVSLAATLSRVAPSPTVAHGRPGPLPQGRGA